MIALTLAADSKEKNERCDEIIADLRRLPGLVQQVLDMNERIKRYAIEVCVAWVKHSIYSRCLV